MWVTLLPLREIRLARRRYSLHLCMQGSLSIRPPIILKRGRFVIQRRNELRDLEAEPVSAVCSDFEGEPVPQDISREQLSRGAIKAQGARLVTLARGFCEHQQSAFFDVRVCPQLLYPVRTKSRNRQYSRRVHDIEQETFTSIIFTTTE